MLILRINNNTSTVHGFVIPIVNDRSLMSKVTFLQKIKVFLENRSKAIAFDEGCLSDYLVNLFLTACSDLLQIVLQTDTIPIFGWTEKRCVLLLQKFIAIVTLQLFVEFQRNTQLKILMIKKRNDQSAIKRATGYFALYSHAAWICRHSDWKRGTILHQNRQRLCQHFLVYSWNT